MPLDDPSEGPIDGSETHVKFEVPAVLRKWPSLNAQRRAIATGPYLLLDGTLDECIREFMAKPARQRHLYEIHTSPQPPLVADVLSREINRALRELSVRHSAGDFRGAHSSGLSVKRRLRCCCRALLIHLGEGERPP
jgi:hypothetical protein